LKNSRLETRRSPEMPPTDIHSRRRGSLCKKPAAT
jgi:hypothetical protein